MAAPEATLIENQGVYLPSVHEIVTAILDVGVGQWMMLGGFIIWAVLLSRPIDDMDQRDHVSGMTYIAYFLAAGTFLVIALPAAAAAKTKSFGNSITVFGILLSICIIRWTWHRGERIEAFKKRRPNQGEKPL